MADQEDLQTGAPGAPASDKEEKPTVEDLQQKLASETARREAAEQERERWRETATARPAEKPEKKEEEPDVDELGEVDLVNIISGNDVDGLSKVVQATVKKTLKAMGVTTKRDVEELVSGRLSEKETKDTGMVELVNAYPDLQDGKSELYQESARQLDVINKDSRYKNLTDFQKVERAVMLADAKLVKSGKGGDQQERARVARIGAQQGSTSVRGSKRNEESDELDADEKLSCQIYGISEADFKKNKAEMQPKGRR